jgi:heavy metal efflux system protein
MKFKIQDLKFKILGGLARRHRAIPACPAGRRSNPYETYGFPLLSLAEARAKVGALLIFNCSSIFSSDEILAAEPQNICSEANRGSTRCSAPKHFHFIRTINITVLRTYIHQIYSFLQIFGGSTACAAEIRQNKDYETFNTKYKINIFSIAPGSFQKLLTINRSRFINSQSLPTAHCLLPTFLFCLLFVFTTNAQKITQDQAVLTALKNNQLIKSAEYQIDYFKQLKKTGTDIGKLSATWMHGQYNSLYQDNAFNLSQNIPFPTTLRNQVRLGREQVVGGQKNLIALQNELAYQVKSTYEQMLYQEALRDLFQSQDSLFNDFARASSLRFKTGESNLLEKTTAETQSLEVKNQLQLNEADIQISAAHLQALLKSELPVYNSEQLQKRPLPSSVDTASLKSNPQLDFLKQQVVISQYTKRVERSRVMPDLMVGYFTQSLTGVQNIDGQDRFFSSSKAFQGFQLGLAIPVWIAPHLARAKAASFQEQATQKSTEHFETMLKGDYVQALRELDKNSASLNYYESSALQNADLIISQSRKAYKGGEIGYLEYLQSLKTALSIKNNYLQSVTQYNQSIIKLEFLLGKF